jgi:hypothetical protein
MSFMGLVSWLGIGGVAGVFAVAYFIPALLPTVAVGLLRGIGEALAGGAQYVGSKLLAGSQHIFASRAAVFTLLFAIGAAGWAGDRYEFVRPYIPAWLQSEPGQVKVARAQEAAKYRPKPKQSKPQKTALRNAWDEVSCGLMGNCTR